MWITPRITDIFILKELRNDSLLTEMLHIWDIMQLRIINYASIQVSLCLPMTADFCGFFLVTDRQNSWHRCINMELQKIKNKMIYWINANGVRPIEDSINCWVQLQNCTAIKCTIPEQNEDRSDFWAYILNKKRSPCVKALVNYYQWHLRPVASSSGIEHWSDTPSRPKHI